jgi:hypothetical protein
MKYHLIVEREDPSSKTGCLVLREDFEARDDDDAAKIAAAKEEEFRRGYEIHNSVLMCVEDGRVLHAR